MFGYLAYISVALFYVSVLNVECAKILAVFPYPNPAQYLTAHTYLRELALRGHNITLIVTNIENVDLSLFRDIKIPFPSFDELIVASAHERERSQRSILTAFHSNITSVVLEHPDVKELITTCNVTFDMVVIDTLMPSALYALGRHFKAHLVGISSGPSEQQVDNLVGNSSPVSFIPVYATGMLGPMNFTQRVKNVFTASLEWGWIYIRELTIQRKFFWKYFPHLETTLNAISSNFSLVLVNHHFSIGVPRPYVPNMIEVGGMYITERADPLPKDLLDFINGAEKGVIYFSMGMNFKSHTIPDDKFTEMLDFCRKTKMRVLWKFENPEREKDLPDNVLARKWFPQRAILAHSNVKVFITQGGFLSVMEAVYHAIPVVGIPIVYNHNINLGTIEKFGMGVILPFKELNNENLTTAVEQVLTREIFARNARKMQQRFNDRPLKPLETAIFWTEYILRHNGAEFMRVPVKDMCFIEFYNLDVLALLITCLSLQLILLFESARRAIYAIRYYRAEMFALRQAQEIPSLQQQRQEEEELQRQQREQQYQDHQREERRQELEQERERIRQEQQHQQAQRHQHHHRRGRRRRF